MSGASHRVLYASRAFESAHTEGGFLLLRDLAEHAATMANVRPAFFSTSCEQQSHRGVNLLPVYGKGEWGFFNALRFSRSLRAGAADFDVVHTAHVTTPRNSYVLRRIRRSAGAKGTRFVQTVTALAANAKLSPEMFWGDAVVCLNEATASKVRRHRADVTVIPPAVRPQRLAERQSMPVDIKAKLADRRVVCIPVDLARLGEFDLRSLCTSLIDARTDITIVVACRFGEEKLARRLLGSLAASDNGRVQIFATIDWILDLFAVSDVVLYPIRDLSGKFSPPLALLEAAGLGARIVAPTAISLDSLVSSSRYACPPSDDIDGWTSAVCGMIDVDSPAAGVQFAFDEMYECYTRLYRSLHEAVGA